jgi:hypothetical protein
MITSFLLKATLLSGLLLLERVVGLPVMSTYFFFGFSETVDYRIKIILITIFSIVISSLYSTHILYTFLLLSAVSLVLNFGLLRKQRFFRIMVLSLSYLVFFWFFVSSLSLGIVSYLIIQVMILMLIQYKFLKKLNLLSKR